MKRELSEEAKGFQEDFTLALRLLRSSEKVQISTLTDLVAENRVHAHVAVECIKHRIRTVREDSSLLFFFASFVCFVCFCFLTQGRTLGTGGAGE